MTHSLRTQFYTELGKNNVKMAQLETQPGLAEGYQYINRAVSFAKKFHIHDFPVQESFDFEYEELDPSLSRTSSAIRAACFAIESYRQSLYAEIYFELQNNGPMLVVLDDH